MDEETEAIVRARVNNKNTSANKRPRFSVLARFWTSSSNECPFTIARPSAFSRKMVKTNLSQPI